MQYFLHPISKMVILLTFWCKLLTIIPLSFSASTLPPIVPKISIPLYHSAMLNDNIKETMKNPILDIYPIENAYAIFLWIGTPIQIVFVLMDLGSPVTWSQCEPCNSCYPMQRSPFNTRASSTFRELGCNSDTCLIPMMRKLFGNCTGWTCRYNINYGKEFMSFGTMITDTLNFEHSNSDEFNDFIMGCGDSYDGTFRTQFSGVLGLGRGQLSVQNQLNTKAFSFCLVSPTSKSPSSLEFYDTPPKLNQQKDSIMVPLRENSGYPFYYFVQFVGISINGFMLDIQSRVWGYGLNYDGGVIFDIGTTATRLPSEAYNVFKEEILKIDHNLTRKKGQAEEFELCYKDDPSNVYPTIELHFENGDINSENFVSLKLNINQTLFRVEQGIVCFSFVEGKGSALTMIGSNQLQGNLLMYDLVNEILVLTYDKC